MPSHESTGPAFAEGSLKVLAVDDHYLVREGVKLAIEQLAPGAEVLEAETVVQAIALYRQHPGIDLVLLDLALPGRSGIESLEAFYAACPDAKVVVVSASHDMRTVQAALSRGVSGFIPKCSGSSPLHNALRFVLNGDVYVPPEAFAPGGGPASHAAAQSLSAVRVPFRRDSPHETGLTARQLDVLELLLEGKSNRQICQKLNLALGTVKTHVAAVLQGLGVATRAQAVAAVDGLGWREIVRSGGKIIRH